MSVPQSPVITPAAGKSWFTSKPGMWCNINRLGCELFPIRRVEVGRRGEAVLHIAPGEGVVDSGLRPPRGLPPKPRSVYHQTHDVL